MGAAQQRTATTRRTRKQPSCRRNTRFGRRMRRTYVREKHSSAAPHSPAEATLLMLLCSSLCALGPDDCVVSHALEWPSLSCQWLPDRVLTPERDFSIQRLILGTHTSIEEPDASAAPAAAASSTGGAAAAASSSSSAAAASSSILPQNYLMIAEVRLPHGDPSLAARTTQSQSQMQAVKFRGGGSNKNDALQLEDEEKTGSAGGSAAAAAAAPADVDAGGYGSQQGKIDIVQRINHQGEVNRARYSPFNPNLIATKSSCAEVFVFDRSKHSSHPSDAAFKPDLVLTGHTAEGYGLAWNPHATSQGMLLSGSNDSLVCLWDISAAAAAPKKKGVPVQTPHLAPVLTLRAHTAVVEDVAWSPFHAEVAASCGDDSQLLLWDLRVPSGDSSSAPGPTQNLNAGKKHHQGNINAISFNLFSEHILASGASQLHRPHTHTSTRGIGQKHTRHLAPTPTLIVAVCSLLLFAFVAQATV